MKYENANNFEKVTMIEHICRMTRRTIRRHIVDPCTMVVRMMCSRLEHAFILLLIEGFLLCVFLAIYDYAPEADASNRQNSFAPHLNGKSNSLSVRYTRKFYIGAIISYDFPFLLFSSFFLFLFFFSSTVNSCSWYILPSSFPRKKISQK